MTTTTLPDVTEAQFATLTAIIAAGGSVRHSYLSGWLGGVKGLKIALVKELAAMGALVVTTDRVARGRLYRGTYTTVTTYTVVK